MKHQEDMILFDDADAELTVSGNIDPLDAIKAVCLTCGGTNGIHEMSCDESPQDSQYTDVGTDDLYCGDVESL